MNVHSHLVRTVVRGIVLLAAGTLVACGGGGGGDTTPVGPTPPVVQAGTLSVGVAAAPGGMTALRLRAIASGLGEPQARGRARLVSSARTGDTLRLVITGVTSGSVFVDLPLTRSGTSVALTILDAAGDATTGYRLLPADSVVLSRTGG